MSAINAILPIRGKGLGPGGVFKRARRGLYHGVMRRTANIISYSEKKTKKHVLPNVFKKTFRSNILDETYSIKVTNKALRIIEKYGGLDSYLLRFKPKEMNSYVGIRLQNKLLLTLKKRKEQAKFDKKVLDAATKEFQEWKLTLKQSPKL